MNRKGSIGILMITIFFIFGVLPALYITAYHKNAKFDKMIGEKQLTLLQTYEKGEIPLYYIDSAAEGSVAEAAYIAGQDGLLVDFGCNDYLGYPVWDMDKEECMPDAQEKFEIEFNKSIKRYFLVFDEKTGEEVPYPEYGLAIENGNLIGMSEKKIRIAINDDPGYDFFLSDGIDDISSEVDDEKGEEENAGENDEGNIESQCKEIVGIAGLYVGSDYGTSGVCFYEDAQSKECTTTCASLVGNIFRYSLGEEEVVYGDGYNKCDSEKAVKFYDQGLLVEGDMYSVLHKDSDNFAKRQGWPIDYGHTGMYVGKGFVSEPLAYFGNGDAWIWGNFEEDENGEYVFIHSYPPKVGFSTYDDLFKHSYTTLDESTITFCRHVMCCIEEGCGELG